MNNKKKGTNFEQEICFKLAQKGYWAHFITPDARGAQPFDIIAVKNGKAYAIDCKTCVANSFSINRMEENQKTAFEFWMKCGNNMPVVVVEHNSDIYVILYPFLLNTGSVKLGGNDAKSKTDDINYIFDFDDFFDRV